MPWYKKLHWQIIIGLVLGLLYGIVAASAGWGQFTSDWIAPFGTLFLNLLQLIAVPLILASLIVGVASLGDLEQLSRIGGKTLGIYVLTTTVALVVGLVLVNSIEPGATVPQEMRAQLEQTYQGDIEESMDVAEEAEGRGPLQPLVDMVPSNFFESASDNGNMLQVVFVAIFFGIGLMLLPKEDARPLLNIFESLFELIIKAVELIMLTAPVGVFGLLADAITSIAAGSPHGPGQFAGGAGALLVDGGDWACRHGVWGVSALYVALYLHLHPRLLPGHCPGATGGVFYVVQRGHAAGHNGGLGKKPRRIRGGLVVCSAPGRYD